MLAERTLAQVLKPVTSPSLKRTLITWRDDMAAAAARLRAAARPARLMPQFLIIGAQKAGTTFLYQELTRHPQVRPALTKEIHYFDDHYDRWRRSYAGFFPPATVSSVQRPVFTGEASPGYAFHPHAIDRIARDLPGVRLIFLVRDPVDRAYSQYQHERRLGYEDAATFAEALEREDARIESELRRLEADPSYVSFSWRHHSYCHRGLYLEQVVRAERAVGPDRLLVVNSDDLFRDPIATVARAVGFLDLPTWQPSTVGTNDMAAGPCSPIDPGLERELRAFFRPHNEALAAHLGCDLGWEG